MTPVVSAALLALLAAPLVADAQCTGSTYSYGSGACASCAAGASFVSASAGCTPSAAQTAGPADTAAYLSGSQAEGVAAFTLVGAAPAFANGPFGVANGSLALAGGSYLTSAAGSAPAALPAGGNVAFAASAWVQCAAAPTYMAALEWGAAGDAQGATPQAAALVVAGAAAAKGGVVTTIAGSPLSNVGGWADGVGAAVAMANLQGIAVLPNGNFLLVEGGAAATAPLGNRIRIVTPSGSVTTIAGNGTIGAADGVGSNASFSNAAGIAVVPSAGVAVLADPSNQKLRIIDYTSGVVTTLAGLSGTAGWVDATGTNARFSGPWGCALIPSTGSIAVADRTNNRCVPAGNLLVRSHPPPSTQNSPLLSPSHMTPTASVSSLFPAASSRPSLAVARLAVRTGQGLQRRSTARSESPSSRRARRSSSQAASTAERILPPAVLKPTSGVDF